MPIAQLAPLSPRHNSLLASLPEAEVQRLAPLLSPVQLEAGQLLHESWGERHAFFPANAVLSLHYTTSQGATAEVACIGSEGVAGVEALLAPDTPSYPLLTRSSGCAFRLPLAALEREFHASPALQMALMGFLRSLLAQLMQATACSRHHAVQQQLCRCLLAGLDRQSGSVLHMTQEFIAGLLGVRRESVTAAARELQQAGAIHYSRGHIHVLDRQRLEAEACECYRLLRDTQSSPTGRRIAA